jgi:basic membrane lipoprotein Med (substrate-binding protein (PBP1-ABC) superfamily)
VFAVIQSAVDGTFQGGQNQTFSVVDLPESQLLAPFNDVVPQEVRDATDEALQKLISGEIDPPATLE